MSCVEQVVDVSHASVHAIAAPVLGGPEVVRVLILNKRFRSRPIDLRYRLHPRPGRGGMVEVLASEF